MTLAEILTVVFLLAVVMAMVAQVLVPSVYLFRIQATRSEVQQGPLVFVHFVQKSLLNTQAESLTFIDNPKALAWVDVRDGDGYDAVTGTPKQASRFSILYFDPAARKVWRKTWPPGPPVAPTVGTYDFAAAKEPLALSAQDLRAICATPNGTDRVLVKDVTSVTITDATDRTISTGTIVLPMHFAITCESRASVAQASDKQVETFSLEIYGEPRSVRW